MSSLHDVCSSGSRGGARGARPPLILGKKEGMTEGRKAGRASKTTPPPPPLAQGLDPLLVYLNAIRHNFGYLSRQDEMHRLGSQNASLVSW